MAIIFLTLSGMTLPPRTSSPRGATAFNRAIIDSKQSSSNTSISIYSASAVTPSASAEEKLIFMCGLNPSE